nr:MAG TPA: hypothetical protein [Caudoviricetes sp.]
MYTVPESGVARARKQEPPPPPRCTGVPPYRLDRRGA